MTRWASPTAILLYKHCPRRFFQHYILKQRGPPGLSLLVGQIIHRVIAKLTRTFPHHLSSSEARLWLNEKIQKELNREWARASPRLHALGLSSKKLSHAYWDAVSLLRRWTLQVVESKGQNLPEKVEVSLSSEKLKLRGVLDAVVHGSDGIELWDYKTSRQAHLSEAIELQLALYALLYQESTGKAPVMVAANFLRGPIYRIPVNSHFLDWARCVVRLFHHNTRSKNIEDYPCRCGHCPKTPKAPRAPETASRKLH